MLTVRVATCPHVVAELPGRSLHGLGQLGIPGFLSPDCAQGDCCKETRIAYGRPFPKEVRFISGRPAA